MPPRAYKITSFDKSLEDIAARFRVADARIILEANQDQFPTGGEDITTMPPRLVGQVIQVPLPDDGTDGWDWGTYVAKGGESLAAVCAKMNKDPRIDPRRRGKGIASPPWLTPEYMLNLFENAEVRGAHGGEPSSVALAPHETVAIPFPRVTSRSRVIRTTPDLPTTFHLDPAWLIELISIYESIRIRARDFEARNVALRAVEKEGLGEVARLAGMQHVLALLKEHPARRREFLTAEMGQLRPVEHALGSLHDAAMEKLYANVLETERPSALHSMLALGRSIIDTMHSHDFLELTKALREHAVRYPLRLNELCASLAYGAQVLADSPLGDEIAPDIEDAVKFVAGKKRFSCAPLASVDSNLARAVENVPSVAEPGSALGVVASMVQNTGGFVTASVGNLPGPSSFAVALFRLQAVRAAAKMLAAGKTATTTEAYTEIATLIAFARNGFTSDEAEGEEILFAIAEIRRTVVSTTTTTTIAPNQAQILARYDRIVTGKAMGAPAWTTGITLTGLFVLGFSVWHMVETGANRTDAVSAASGLASSSLGAIQLFRLAGPKALKSAARGAAFLGLALSAGQWLQDAQAGKDTTADKLATGGAALLATQLIFASLIPEPFAPVLAVAGGLLLIGSFVYSLVQEEVVRNLFRTRAKIWFLGQTRTFRLGAHYKAAGAGLEPKANALENAILAADFFYVDRSQQETLSNVLAPTEVGMLLDS